MSGVWPFNFQTKLNGFWNWYGQNFSEYPKDNPAGAGIIAQHAAEFLFLPKDESLRYVSVEVRPQLFITRDDVGFTIWGPFYSLTYEAAKYINYR